MFVKHICVMHHISISPCIRPMIDVGVWIQTRLFILVNMGSNQIPLFKKRYYQVKIKSLEITNLRELVQLMGQIQRQAFRKAYGKIWDLATIEVSVEAIASLTQYYDQPLRCFTFEDFQLVPRVEEFEEILGCPLGGRKPYLFSGFYPSMARVAKVVKISAQELDWVKQNRNGVVEVPWRCLEEKAKALANQGEWTSFIDMLALLIFGDVKRAAQELFVVHRLSMSGWFHTFFAKKVGPFVCYKVTARVPRKERRIRTNSWLAWKRHPLIGSLVGRKEEPRFCPRVKDFQMFP